MKMKNSRWKGICIGVTLANVMVFRTVFPKPLKKWTKESYDCALVCGYPAKQDGTGTDILKSRVLKAVELWQQNKVKYFVFSGANVKNEYVEAEVMKEYAKTLGVPEEIIFTEKKARSTYHNMMYAKEVMKEQHMKDCVVVTSAWHLRKANHYAQKFGLDYVMCPAKEPEEGKLSVLWKYLSTAVQMHWNFYRGLY